MNKNFVKINQDTWARKNTFIGFSHFEIPLLSIDFDLVIGDSFKFCKENKIPFFFFILFHLAKAANEVENFRYRISEEGEVLLYDKIHPDWVHAIGGDSDNIRPVYCEFKEEFNEFITHAQTEYTEVNFGSNEDYNYLFYASCLPWLNFKSVKQAHYKKDECIPKFIWGKVMDSKLPFSVQAHHGLVDGYHISLLKNKMEENINEHIRSL